MTFRQAENEIIVRSDDRLFSLEDVFSGKVDGYLKHSWEYAALSEYVYQQACTGEVCSLTQRPEGWTQLSTLDEVFSRDDKGFLHGLKMRTFFRKEEREVYVAYAFRGTRFTKLNDWLANLHWLYGWVPFTPMDYYRQVREKFHDHVEATHRHLREKFALDDVSIKHITTGHSLGGGLAQQAAYASERVKLSYVFDSSPVTGFFSVERAKRKASCQDLRIYRFYEHGEILAYLRAITQIGYAFNFKPNRCPLVVELRTNLTKGNPVAQHGIDIHRAVGDMLMNMREKTKLESIRKVAEKLKQETSRVMGP